MKFRKLAAILVSVLTAAAVLTGCGSSSLSADTAEYYYDGGMNYTSAAYEYDSEEYSDSIGGSISGTEVTDERKLITNVNLEIQTTDFDAAQAAIDAKVTELGGYISNETTDGTADSSWRYAYYTIRVPSEKLDEFLSGVGGLGTVTSVTKSVDDITADYTDYEAHLEVLKAQETRLTELLAQAETLEDVIALEDKLTDVQYQIDSISGQLRYYDNQVDYSTVWLDLSQVDNEVVVNPTFGQRILEALRGSAENIGRFLQNFVIWLIYALPFLILIALVVFIIAKIRRATAGRRAARRAAKAERKAALAAARAAKAAEASEAEKTEENKQ